MVRRVLFVCVLLALAATTGSLYADEVTVGGQAVATGVCEDSSGNFVGVVTVDVTAGWLNTPHSIRVSITSDNLVENEPHGEGVFELAGLAINGDISAGVASVIVDWETAGLDTNPTSAEHVYEVTASVIFADNHESDPTTTGNFRFSDCF